MLVSRRFHFDAAHNLIRYHGKCERLHGHRYHLEVTVKGKRDAEGMVMDFTVLKNEVKSHVLDMLDHSYINEIIEQPTAENIAVWIWERLNPALSSETVSLHEIKVFETNSSYVSYHGEDA